MGLWYPKDFRFELIVYSDADHAGCKDDCKITSGGLQFLGGKLVSWSSKKQDCTAMSTDEAEYVSLSACCAQHSKTKHIDIRYHFIKEHVEKGTVELYFVGTEYQLADLFTKALPRECFEYLVHRIARSWLIFVSIGRSFVILQSSVSCEEVVKFLNEVVEFVRSCEVVKKREVVKSPREQSVKLCCDRFGSS
ncbi:hypothetical protein Tco_0836618 [Tanacetum coccineum]